MLPRNPNTWKFNSRELNGEMLCDVKHFAMRKGEMKLEKCNHVEPKKDALNMLYLMLKSYPDYKNMSLMNFYSLLKKLEKNVY